MHVRFQEVLIVKSWSRIILSSGPINWRAESDFNNYESFNLHADGFTLERAVSSIVKY